MSVPSRAASRALGSVGATVVAVATFVAWYDFDVVFDAGGVTHVVEVPVDLWSTSSLAAALLLGAAVAAVVLMNLPWGPAAGRAAVVVALIGLGIAAYAAVRCFALPDLGMDAAPVAAGLPAAAALTHLDGGPFLALAGALMLIAGAAGLLPGSADAREPARAAPAV